MEKELDKKAVWIDGETSWWTKPITANFVKLFPEKDVKEFISRRTNRLKAIELLLMSNSPSDWDVALDRVRALINDKDKLAGDKLTK